LFFGKNEKVVYKLLSLRTFDEIKIFGCIARQNRRFVRGADKDPLHIIYLKDNYVSQSLFCI
jgi:hypothetical protein